MAKSLRSKWRRKCRAVKRERYGAKELERLKKTLGLDESGHQDVNMSEISEIATVTNVQTIKNQLNSAIKNKESSNNTEEMDVDNKRIYNNKTMKDQYGNYPVWMNKRRLAKHKKGRGKTMKSTTKPDKRLTRKQRKKLKKAD
ncbi:protein LLP homolog [Chelonus insularis]|uniref:protein LLP homolog n=1 Tax=Chelonus insularis TaxID=460826 RepID=UPI0015897A22|nr:protein LLP homolog [Chelonus insularis]